MSPSDIFGATLAEQTEVTDVDTMSASDPVGTCALFGRCGGCSMLDRSVTDYVAEKQATVAGAFASAGLAPDLAPLRRVPFASRRRATFTVQADAAGVRVGYQAARSHDVVDVAACPALDPGLARALSAIRRIGTAAGNGARLTATLVDNGIDVAVVRPKGRETRRRQLGEGNPAIVRLTVDGDIAFAAEQPVVRFDGVAVPFPPAAFLQPSRAGERHLTELVLAATDGAGNVLDAFAGLGTFTLPLSARSRVTAVEGDAAAVAALAHAIARAPGRKPVTALRRDLMRDPLAPRELAFDAAVFDPPRAGAQALARSLAAASVARIVAVSCEPRTLCRDAAILVAAGYKITQASPVDQFVGSRHIEVVAIFERT